MARRLSAIMILCCASLLAACADRRATPMPALTSGPEPQPPQLSRSLATQEGIASWYGQSHHGKKTASGEVFNMEALTAAHRNLPFGTVVRVTHLATDRTVTVRINDRGPYTDGRIIDLSARSARDLGIARLGIAKVRIEPISSDQLSGR